MTRRGGLSQYPPGSGGILFISIIQALTMPMTYEQRKILYRGMYSVYLGKLEIDPKYKEDEKISMLVGATKILLDQQGETYNPKFETHESYSPLENNYAELQAQIFDKHMEIINRAKMIETVILEQDMVG